MKHKKDVILIALALAAALGVYLFSQLAADPAATTVVVTQGGSVVLRRPLAMNATYEIKGENGELNVVCVENGEVYMQEANCRDGLCIRQGHMKNPAKTIVCLPNEVVVSLEGADGETSIGADDIDVIIQ